MFVECNDSIKGCTMLNMVVRCFRTGKRLPEGLPPALSANGGLPEPLIPTPVSTSTPERKEGDGRPMQQGLSLVGCDVV